MTALPVLSLSKDHAGEQQRARLDHADLLGQFEHPFGRHTITQIL